MYLYDEGKVFVQVWGNNEKKKIETNSQSQINNKYKRWTTAQLFESVHRGVRASYGWQGGWVAGWLVGQRLPREFNECEKDTYLFAKKPLFMHFPLCNHISPSPTKCQGTSIRPFPTFIYNLAALLILLDARLAAVENQFHSATGAAVQLPWKTTVFTVIYFTQE